MMEFVLCILIRVDDKIQTAQCIDVAQFLSNIESFPENQVCERGNLRVKGRRPFSCCQIVRGFLELRERGESRTLGTNGRDITCDRS
jgi:hypothetical protein